MLHYKNKTNMAYYKYHKISIDVQNYIENGK